jgi:hypothetical protein
MRPPSLAPNHDTCNQCSAVATRIRKSPITSCNPRHCGYHPFCASPQNTTTTILSNITRVVCRTHPTSLRAATLPRFMFPHFPTKLLSNHATTSHAPPKHDAGCNPPRIQLRWDNPSAWNRSGAIPGGHGSTSVAAIAKRHTLPMVVGMAERGVAPNGTQALWDTAVLFDSDGSVLGKHRKINVLSELMTKPCADPTPFF